MSVTRDDVLAALAGITSPDGSPFALSGRLSAVVIRDGGVALSISIEPREAAAWEPVRQIAERAIAALGGVTRVTVALTAEATTPSPSLGAAPAKRDGVKSGVAAARPASFPNLAKVRHIVAVASGKGGVGKSTTACNIALALATLSDTNGRRLRIGVLDADIYGPSMPKLFALRGQPRIVSGRTLEPLEGYGV